MRVEIAVIGGGVNGLAIARQLAARHGAGVAVFDDRRLGAASRAAAGLLGAQVEAAGLPEALRPKAFPLLRESRLLHEFLDLHLRESSGERPARRQRSNRRQNSRESLGSFEDFCVVTQSVRDGLDVRVHVEREGRSSPRRGDGTAFAQCMNVLSYRR